MSETKGIIDVMRRILGDVKGVVGDEAYEAMFRYAAVQEGRRLAGTTRNQDLQAAIDQLDAILGQRTRLIDNGGEGLRVHVMESPLFDNGDPVTQALVIGLLQGVVSAKRRREYQGSLVPPPEEGFRGLLLEFEPDGGDQR